MDVEDAWLDLEEKLARGEGVTCPCCGQHAQVYRRGVNSTQARALIRLYLLGQDWLHVPTMIGNGTELEKLRWWGLVEESNGVRDDGGRAGFWRITSRGRRFVEGVESVPRKVLIYNNRLVEFDDSEMVTIREALGTRFDYRELMAGN